MGARAWWINAVALAVGCGAAQTPDQNRAPVASSESAGAAAAPTATAADREAIAALYTEFSAAYRTLDPARLANVYSEDAFYLSPKAPVRRGRDTIFENFRGFFERTRAKGHRLDISFDFLERRAAAALAYDVGVYTLVTREGDSIVNTSRGKFVVVLLKEADGAWRMRLDAYSGLPAETAD